MPIYEFVCRECGTHFEQMQSFSATSMPSCPACSSHHVSRLLSRPAIHFKGSGWYVTDSKNTGKGAAKDAASGGSAKTSASAGEGDAGAAKSAGDSAKAVKPAAAAEE